MATYETPPTGKYVALIADVRNLGPCQTEHGTTDKIRVTWLLNRRGSQGFLYSVVDTYLFSTGPKSRWHQFVVATLGHWPGQSPELVSLWGLKRNVQVVHVEHQGKVYANIGSIEPVAPAQPIPPQPQAQAAPADLPF